MRLHGNGLCQWRQGLPCGKPFTRTSGRIKCKLPMEKKALLKGKEINKPLWTIEPQVREPVRR